MGRRGGTHLSTQFHSAVPCRVGRNTGSWTRAEFPHRCGYRAGGLPSRAWRALREERGEGRGRGGEGREILTITTYMYVQPGATEMREGKLTI